MTQGACPPVTGDLYLSPCEPRSKSAPELNEFDRFLWEDMLRFI